MLRTELLEIIASGENSGIEFKRDDIRPEQLAIEVVAMANFQGGLNEQSGLIQEEILHAYRVMKFRGIDRME